MQQQLITYLRAGYPGLAIITPEESRAEAEVAATCDSLQLQLHAWSSTEGLVAIKENRVTTCPDPLEALRLISRLFEQAESRHLVVMRDLQLHLEATDPLLVRQLKDLLKIAKSNGHCLILLGCRFNLSPELEHEITVLPCELPDASQLETVLHGILESAQLDLGEDREAILHAALGLTTIEAENAFALSIIETGRIDAAVVAREKARTLKRGGLVEVVETSTSLEQVGGLDELKQWLSSRAACFSAAAKAYGLPSPKGLLIVGIPGTGKSLTAKATASAFRIPLLRLDMGKVFGGIVGQSEANLRAVIQTAEAISPCVLWIDEIEKGFSGSSGGSTDGGTSSRVFGSFLSWMQEKHKPVFVVATANDVSKLPPEFLRKGRFDELFFVDLPDHRQRRAIWEIVIRKYGRDSSAYDIAALARETDGFTGAEIEAVFVEAMHAAFVQAEEPAAAHLAEVIGQMIPLSKLMEADIGRLREWSKGRTRNASTSHVAPRTTRKINRSN